MNVGKSIRTIRKSKKVSQGDLAHESGITRSYLSAIETGKRQASTAVLEDISKAIGVPLPFIQWMSIENKDIRPEKLKGFKLIRPHVDALLKSLFQEHSDINEY